MLNILRKEVFMGKKTNMKERPILFSAPMVRAILEGRKTQTRRVVKSAPDAANAVANLALMPPSADGSTHKLWWRDLYERLIGAVPACPYGQPGDRLWVRETWRIGAWREDGGRLAFDYRASPEITITPWVTIPDDDDGEKFCLYWSGVCDELRQKCVYADSDDQYRWEQGKAPLRWRPSIYMPRWASRITLEIVSVRVERLNEISKRDCIAEGMVGLCDVHAGWHQSYADFWESINGAGSWQQNPWVWVVEFKRVDA